MILIDASTRWSHICLLSTRKKAFAKSLAQLIKFRVYILVLDDLIKKIRLDNANEFTSYVFHEYCISIGIKVKHVVAHVHIQNGLA